MTSTSSPAQHRRMDTDERRAPSSLAHGGGGNFEGASVTSHASSSRLHANGYAAALGTASPSSSSATGAVAASGSSASRTTAPISLADALARAGGDTTRALDEVLAERNRFCLENGKLAGENVRIWNLMGRIRKENETLKGASGAARGNTASPLGPPPRPRRQQVGGTSSSEHDAEGSDGVQGQGASASASTSAASSLAEVTGLRGESAASRGASLDVPGGTSSGSASPSQPKRSMSGDTTPSAHTPGIGAAAAATATIAAAEAASAQSSIMAQRAAAQRRLGAPLEASSEVMARGASYVGQQDDFDAVDGSSVGGGSARDENEPQQQGMGGSAGWQSSLPSSPGTFGRELPAGGASAGANGIPPSPSTLRGHGSVGGGGGAPTTPTRGSFAHARASSGVSHGSNRSISNAAAATPILDTQTLRDVQIQVVGSHLRSNERGREIITFVISVAHRRGAGPQSPTGAPAAGAPAAPQMKWKIEKLYSDVMALDARLKQKHGKNAAKRIASAELPSQALFRDHAPSKVDQRKAILEYYLQNLLAIQLPDKDDLCTFLCTDVVPPRPKDVSSTTREGFLTKKGQNMGRWVTRLYVLAGAQLDYYESRGGAHLGSISIAGAQIGRQQRNATTELDENSYRHAFLILEKRPPTLPGEGAQMVRHVLCAESDTERDEWVEVLVRAIAELERQTRGERTARTSSSREAGRAPVQAGTADSSAPSERGAMGPPLSRPSREQATRKDSAGGEEVRGIQAPSQGTIASRRAGHEAVGSGAGLPALQVARSHAQGEGKNSFETSLASPRSTSFGQGPLASPRNASFSMAAQTRSASQDISTGDSARPVTPDANARSGAPVEARMSESTARTRPSISGPMNGTPIPTGYKFGKDESASSSSGTAPVESYGTGAGKKEDKKPRFWHRFGGGTDKDPKQGPRPVFGVPLAESIAISHIADGLELPSVVYRCIEFLEKRNAATEEGIYRLSGSSNVVKALKDRFNAEGDVDLLAPGEPYYDVHAVAGLLKTFLRELPQSVLTRELHLEFMRVNDVVERRERISELGALVSVLPLANYSLLRTLCSHLIKIIELSDVNKMTMRNVGIVFSPTLGIPAGVFALFLTEFDWVFYTSAQGEPMPRQMDEDILAPDKAELGDSMHFPLANAPDDREYPGTPAQQVIARAAAAAAAAEAEAARNQRRGNRQSWIAGGQVHTGDGQVLSLNTGLQQEQQGTSSGSSSRNNRNSLQYDAAEADRLLGPQSQGRLNSRRDGAGEHDIDDEAHMYEAGDFGAGLDDASSHQGTEDGDSNYASPLSPRSPRAQLHGLANQQSQGPPQPHGMQQYANANPALLTAGNNGSSMPVSPAGSQRSRNGGQQQRAPLHNMGPQPSMPPYTTRSPPPMA